MDLPRVTYIKTFKIALVIEIRSEQASCSWWVIVVKLWQVLSVGLNVGVYIMCRIEVVLKFFGCIDTKIVILINEVSVVILLLLFWLFLFLFFLLLCKQKLFAVEKPLLIIWPYVSFQGPFALFSIIEKGNLHVAPSLINKWALSVTVLHMVAYNKAIVISDYL